MGKAIKVQDATYDRLVDVQDKRETFDHEINRLLDLYVTMNEVKERLGPGHLVRRKVANEEG